MKTKYLLLPFLLFVSCSVKDNVSHISSIEVLYYNYFFESPTPVDYNEMKPSTPSKIKFVNYNSSGDSVGYWVDNSCVIDTLITNKHILKQIEAELIATKCDSLTQSIDARICCLIKYKNGETKRIILSGLLADNVIYNGKKLMKNNRLVFWIKYAIGYYDWMGEFVLNNSEELFDTTFERPKVKSNFNKLY